MRFRWLGTAGFEFSSGDSRLLIDPYLTRNQLAFPRQDLRAEDFAGTDAVLVTHGHFDHVYDVPSIVQASGCRVFGSTPACRKLYGRGVGAERLEAVENLSAYEVGPFRVTAISSRHVVFDIPLIARTVIRSIPHLFELAAINTTSYPAGDVYGYLVEVEGRSFFHIGSAWLNREVLEDRAVDIFFVPVQGRTDIAALAAQMTAELKPRMVVPHHYDDFFPPLSQLIDLDPFKQALFELMPRARVIAPSLNQWIEI